MNFGMPELIFIPFLVVSFITLVPFWKIFSKAGFSGWLSLLTLVPIANIIVLFFLAFSKWPIHKNQE
ncbi:MAG: hypothetical protein H0Z35_10605 [Thermoanaerobacteraceae bacterium]|nr:hypothetical protein [Thermoanaerobacteraceae bacterium]